MNLADKFRVVDIVAACDVNRRQEICVARCYSLFVPRAVTSDSTNMVLTIYHLPNEPDYPFVYKNTIVNV